MNQLIENGRWGVIDRFTSKNDIPLMNDKIDQSIDFSQFFAENPDESQINHWEIFRQNQLEKIQNYYIIENDILFSFMVNNSPIANDLCLIDHSFNDFEHFHHLIFKPKLNIDYNAEIVNNNSNLTNDKESRRFDTIQSLSGSAGSIFINENIEGIQPFELNVGMKSVIVSDLDERV
ncbi:hypothetical protein TRFO_08575 [Tritrichomonas foetus]|uniref:Uncharacterized protein n=1 Tax=Tritrichomonas foetus TaxID=1144522 RepID=A0A1J4JKU4_9EUKA|nr:hypothetical protein TRFO_08575 [Tritrichomonas foetus]|eukprot:OHS99023.1 hypothetical protein TRFO_08575 [Tritrichomonas foetus]